MGKRIKRSSLVLGQIAKPATTPSLAGFYKNVAAGTRGAVEDITKGVEQKTQGLGEELGLTETVDKDTGKVSTGMGDKFKVTVDTGSKTISGGPQPASTPAGGTPPPAEKTANKFTLATDTSKSTSRTTTAVSSLEDLDKDLKTLNTALKTLGSGLDKLKASGEDASKFLEDLLASSRKSAQEVIDEVNSRLSEENLGKIRNPSELEKQAESYQNIIADLPGTSNIEALKNLYSFYDMARYGTLESGLRQGELALSRQEMQGEKSAMEAAESGRASAIGRYGKQSKFLTDELGEELTSQEEAERKKLADYYAGLGAEIEKDKKATETEIGNVKKDITKKEEEAVNNISNEVSGDYEDSNLQSVLDNILELPEGRWLRNQGVAKLQPLKTELANLADQIEQIKANPNIDNRTKVERLKTLKNDMNNVRQRAIGELLAFMDDDNHMVKDPDGALQAISLIGGRSNLMKFITEDQKNTAQRLTEKAATTYMNLATSWSKGWPREVNGVRDWSGFPFNDRERVDLFAKHLSRARSAAGTGVIMFGKQDASNYETLKKIEKEFEAKIAERNQMRF